MRFKKCLKDCTLRLVEEKRKDWIREIWVLTLTDFEIEKSQKVILRDLEAKLQQERLERKKLLRSIDDSLLEISHRKDEWMKWFWKSNFKSKWIWKRTQNSSNLWKQVKNYLKILDRIHLMLQHPVSLIRCSKTLSEDWKKKKE